VKFGTEQEALA